MVQELQQQMQVLLARAIEAAGETADQLRRDRRRLRDLHRHPQRARQQLGFAKTLLEQANTIAFTSIPRSTPSAELTTAALPSTRLAGDPEVSGAAPPGTPEEGLTRQGWSEQVQQLREGFAVIESAGERVSRLLTDGQERLTQALQDLDLLEGELRTVRGHADVRAVTMQLDLARARSDLRDAEHHGRQGGQHAYAAVRVVLEARRRQEITERGPGLAPPPASPSGVRPGPAFPDLPPPR